MKILLIHNKYQHQGGEDVVFKAEYDLLINRKHVVQKLIFNNNVISSFKDKILSGIFAIYNPRSAKLLEKKIKTFEPDVIHVHNFFFIASPSVFYVANKLNVPIVMTIHNYRLICPSALLFRKNQVCEKCINKVFAIDGIIHGCYRNSKIQTSVIACMNLIHIKRKTWLTKVDQYIALTYFAKYKILYSSLNLQEHQVTVKPNFVEDCGYDYSKEDYFLFIGRLSDEKGIDLLLKVFSKNNKKLLVIGSGPLEGSVKKTAKNNQNIIYLGYKDKDFIMKKIKKAKALLCSSIWYEGMPMVILESFSAATPVIVPNIGGPNEMVNDGYNGLIYKVNNENDLMEKIKLIDTDSELNRNLCVGARKDYENKYTSEKNYEFLMNIYYGVISAKRQGV